MSTLQGVYLKVERARKHADQLCAEMSKLDENDPDVAGRIVVEKDTKAQEYVPRWVGKRHCPARWSLMLGEIFYNMRSALDHFAWQLTLRSEAKVTKTTQLPICISEHDFKRVAGRALKGVHLNYVTLIEGIQPYRAAPNDPCSSVLWLIGRLNNIDKHRLLHVVEHQVSDARLLLSVDGQMLGPPPITKIVAAGTRLDPQTELARIPWRAFDRLVKRKVYVHSNLGTYIAFGKGQPVEDGDESIESMPVVATLRLCVEYMEEEFLPFINRLWRL